ncbi:translation elongation factor Ts [Phycisphaeraceae bacterium D3-23]
MAAISAKDVMQLRKATGLGMMECKKALVECDGDFDKATEYARTKFGAKMATRSDRESGEGKIAIAVNGDNTKGVIVLVNTETDFTAKNDEFGAMVQQIADLALSQDAGTVKVTDEMEALMQQVRLTTAENVQFGTGVVYEGDTVGSYVHFTGKVGVLIDLGGKADEQLCKDLCMHVSAIVPAPMGVTEDEVPAEAIEKEKAAAKAEAIESGKPEDIAEKMVVGKMRKYMDSIVLLRQPFVKDDKQQIQDILSDGVTIKAFTKLAIG